MEDFFQLMIGAILFLTKFASFTWLKLPISSLNYETRNCHTYRYWHFIYKTTITYLVQERTMSHRGLMSRAAGAVLKLHHSPSIPCRRRISCTNFLRHHTISKHAYRIDPNAGWLLGCIKGLCNLEMEMKEHPSASVQKPLRSVIQFAIRLGHGWKALDFLVEWS